MAPFCGLFVLLALVCSGLGEDNDKQPSCSKVKIAYRSKRLAESDVPTTAVDGGDLRVCPRDSGKQCCSQRMEDRFAVLARSDFDKAVSDQVDGIKELFNEQAKAFDVFVRNLIKKSQTELDTMFKKIYGSHYELNTKIFMDLFVDLTSYYNGANSDLTTLMEKFFTNLMRRMFQIMNNKYQFTNSYLDCVSRHRKELTPFGDIPEKLIPQVKKALVQARTFSQALHVGRDVVNMLGNTVSTSKDCENQLIKLKYCSWCKAMTTLKPCHKFCTDVHKSCLTDVAKVNTHWQSFITALHELVEKQLGPNNVQDVIAPINLKISFAIMDFQKKEVDVREKVFVGCGTPKGVSKRSTDDFFIEGNNRQRRDDDEATLARSLPQQPNLDKLSTSFKAKMKVASNFWLNLGDTVCGDDKGQNSDCWNGVGKGSYTSPNDGGNDLKGDASPAVQKAIDKLKEMVVQLKAAMEGEEVNMIDNEDGDDGSSGSGSASGESSGENEIPTRTEETPTDSGNEIEDENDVQGGGVNKPSAESRSTASQHMASLWSLCAMLYVLFATLSA